MGTRLSGYQLAEMSALADLGRNGAAAPSVPPWKRAALAACALHAVALAVVGSAVLTVTPPQALPIVVELGVQPGPAARAPVVADAAAAGAVLQEPEPRRRRPCLNQTFSDPRLPICRSRARSFRRSSGRQCAKK